MKRLSQGPSASSAGHLDFDAMSDEFIVQTEVRTTSAPQEVALLRLSRPVERGEDNFGCRLRIEFRSHPYDRELFGVDSLDALQTAIALMNAVLGMIARETGVTFQSNDLERIKPRSY
jgi:hypothetical protein